MRVSRWVNMAWVAVAMSVFVVMAPGGRSLGPKVVFAQQTHTPPPPTQLPGMPSVENPNGIPDQIRVRAEADRIKMANDDRHKRLEADAAKLISLSNELKADIDKAGKDELSMEVIRKAGEIEKLAHDVQGRMKN